MKRSLLIALMAAAAISCTACGKIGSETADIPIAVTATVKTEAATTTSDNIIKTTAKAKKISYEKTTTETTYVVATEAPPAATAVTTETAANIVTTKASETITSAVTTQSVTTQSATAAQTTVTENEATQPVTTPHRPAGTPPSPEDSDYAPAPLQYNTEGLTYIHGALIANKSYSLPAGFNPGLAPTCQAQFNKMANDAYKQGLKLKFSSGFRSYNDQYIIYNNYVARDGQAAADTYSARAGFSEHQSGLAIDVNSIDHSFDGTPEAIWLENHCHEYGFIIRYPQGKENITGYQYESWHIRYLGTDLSYPVHSSGLTLEEYFGIDSYYH